MNKVTIIDNEFITLWYHPEEKIVHHQFHKRSIFSKFLREALNKGTELLLENSASKWLSDDRNHAVLALEDTAWGYNEWFPKTKKAGWKYWALVQPELLIGKLELERFTSEYAKQGVTVKCFSDVDEAFNWLKSIDE